MITTYTMLKLIHIVSAIVAVGANLTYFIWFKRARRATPAEQAFALQGVKSVDVLANVGYAVLPVTGVLMVLDANLGFGRFWIATAIGLYVLVGAMAGALFTPALRRQLQLVQSGTADPTVLTAAAKRTTISGALTMVPIAAILYLMVIKPAP